MARGVATCAPLMSSPRAMPPRPIRASRSGFALALTRPVLLRRAAMPKDDSCLCASYSQKLVRDLLPATPRYPAILRRPAVAPPIVAALRGVAARDVATRVPLVISPRAMPRRARFARVSLWSCGLQPRGPRSCAAPRRPKMVAPRAAFAHRVCDSSPAALRCPAARRRPASVSPVARGVAGHFPVRCPSLVISL